MRVKFAFVVLIAGLAVGCAEQKPCSVQNAAAIGVVVAQRHSSAAISYSAAAKAVYDSEPCSYFVQGVGHANGKRYVFGALVRPTAGSEIKSQVIALQVSANERVLVERGQIERMRRAVKVTGEGWQR